MQPDSDRFISAHATEEQASAFTLRKDAKGLNPVISFSGREDYPFLVSYDADHSNEQDITRSRSIRYLPRA